MTEHKQKKDFAGGWGALRSSTKKMFEGGDPFGTFKALTQVNKPGGFDCPGQNKLFLLLSHLLKPHPVTVYHPLLS